MNAQPAPPLAGSPVIVRVIPGQNSAVWARALLLAESWSAPLIAAFLDPASYLIEWTPGNQILPISLEPVLDPDDDSAIAAAQLKESPAVAVAGYGVDWSLRVIGGDPALALGRRASEMAFKSRMFTSTIMVHRRG